MKNETGLKLALMKAIKEQLPLFVALRHEDVRSNGIPDISLTGNGRTTWWECKHGTPRFESRGIQELTMLRLAREGFARYLIWQEEKNGLNKRTIVVHPSRVKDVHPEVMCVDFNMQWLIEQMKKAHELH